MAEAVVPMRTCPADAGPGRGVIQPAYLPPAWEIAPAPLPPRKALFNDEKLTPGIIQPLRLELSSELRTAALHRPATTGCVAQVLGRPITSPRNLGAH